MTKYVHIVQVHPVENWEPNLSKVRKEKEFDTKEAADAWIEHYNDSRGLHVYEAVYLGRVNDTTGELE